MTYTFDKYPIETEVWSSTLPQLAKLEVVVQRPAFDPSWESKVIAVYEKKNIRGELDRASKLLEVKLQWEELPGRSVGVIAGAFSGRLKVEVDGGNKQRTGKVVRKWLGTKWKVAGNLKTADSMSTLDPNKLA
jgi:hypothetical protein